MSNRNLAAEVDKPVNAVHSTDDASFDVRLN